MIFGRGFPLQCFPFPHKKTAIRLPKSAKIFFFATAIQYTSINERQNITPDFNPVSRVQHIPGPRTKFQLKQQPEAPTHGRPRRTLPAFGQGHHP